MLLKQPWSLISTLNFCSTYGWTFLSACVRESSWDSSTYCCFRGHQRIGKADHEVWVVCHIGRTRLHIPVSSRWISLFVELPPRVSSFRFSWTFLRLVGKFPHILLLGNLVFNELASMLHSGILKNLNIFFKDFSKRSILVRTDLFLGPRKFSKKLFGNVFRIFRHRLFGM